MTTPVRVHVTFNFPSEENCQAFANLFKEKFIPRTLKEDGCLLYDVWIPNGKPTALYLVESWSSQQALDTHLAQDWMKELLPETMALQGEGNKPAFDFCRSVMD